jgi:serine/threonine protein kinase
MYICTYIYIYIYIYIHIHTLMYIYMFIQVAIKRMTNIFDDRTDAKRAYREMHILRHLKHPNIIKLLDVLSPTIEKKMVGLQVYYMYLWIFIHVFIYVCMCVCVCICIFMFCHPLLTSRWLVCRYIICLYLYTYI